MGKKYEWLVDFSGTIVVQADTREEAIEKAKVDKEWGWDTEDYRAMLLGATGDDDGM